jgi:hypothetical protein
MGDGGSICFADSLDALASSCFAALGVPTALKKIFPAFAPAFAVLIFSCLAFADDFKSLTIGTGATMPLPKVHADQFMVIRNFTQDDLVATRGVVTVTKPPGGTPVNVLSAAALDASPPDIINNVVIAGPADVSVTCGDTNGNCFISFKKDSN